MAHGQPDYGLYAPIKVVHSIADVGELAARLGSIVTYDRRGNVMWLEDFESGIDRWDIVKLGTGAAAVASAKSSRSGAISAKLTTGDEDGDSIIIRRFFPYPVSSRIGLEVSFTTDSDLKDIFFEFYFYDKDNYYRPAVYLSIADAELLYADSGFNPQVLENGLSLAHSRYFYHTVKLVIDLEAKEYVRVLFNNKSYDLLGKGIYQGSPGDTEYFTAYIEPFTNVNDNISIYVDDIIVTQNEP